METLAGGVGFGAPRHQQQNQNNSTSQKMHKVKKKQSKRFNFCQCGGNTSLYDEGLNTSFVASSSPSEKVIGRIRAGSSSQVAIPPPMPSIEYLPLRTQQQQQAAIKQVQSKTKNQDGTIDVDRWTSRIIPLVPAQVVHQNRNQKIQSEGRLSPSETLTGSFEDDGNLSVTSFSPRAQVMTAVRTNILETAYNQIESGKVQSLHSSTDHTVLVRDDVESAPSFDTRLVEGFVKRWPVSSFASVGDYSAELGEEVDEASKQKSKRIGGFIAMPSSEVSFIHSENRSDVNSGSTSSVLTSNRQTTDSKTLLPCTLRSSLASSMSIYSTRSPYLDTRTKLSSQTIGSEERDTKFRQYHHQKQQQDQLERPYNYLTEAPHGLTSRDSTSSGHQTNSIMTSPSIQGSEQSPAIGEVLSHFPSLKGMAGGFTSTRSHTSEADDDYDDELLSSRINTFGPSRRHPFIDHDNSPARINSFHYDEELTFQLQRRQSSFSSLNTSPVSSTNSSVDSLSTASSHRSHKRTAVLCGLSSNDNPTALRLRSDNEGDLTWQERLLSFSKIDDEEGDKSEGCNGDNDNDRSITLRSSGSNLTLRTPVTSNNTRGRGSSNSHIPFSSPPDLPLPPVPPHTTKQRGQHVRSSNSFMSTDHFQSRPNFHYRSTATSLPRSVTCPDFAEGGYAF